MRINNFLAQDVSFMGRDDDEIVHSTWIQTLGAQYIY